MTEKKIKKKPALQLLEEVQKTPQVKERQFVKLRRQQEILQKEEMEKEAQRVTEAVIRRAATQLTASDHKFPESARSKPFRLVWILDLEKSWEKCCKYTAFFADS